MADLIDRQAAIKAIEDLQDCYNGFSDTYDKACIIGVLEEVPSAQPEIKCIAKIMLTEEQVQEAFEKAKKEILAAQRERKKGKFIGTEYDGYADGNPVYYEWKCSECGCIFEDEEPTYNFCPNCGADMRGEQNDSV